MNPTRLLQATHEIVTYAHTPEYGTDLEDVLAPEYWSHVSSVLKPGYVVVVTAADLSWRAELMVRASGRAEAIMGVVSHVEFGEAPSQEVEESPFEVKWRGPARKFGVVRKSDGNLVKEDIQTKEAAYRWVKNHLIAVNA